MIKTASLGFPRIGANRELKKAVESFWKKSSNEADLKKSAQEIRHNNWQLQQKSGIDFGIAPLTTSIAGFMADPTQMAIEQIFVTNEPYFARKKGADIHVLRLGDTGWDPYRVIFTTREFAAKHPDVVRRFVAASRQGWLGYLKGDASAADKRIQEKNPAMTPDYIDFVRRTLNETGMVEGQSGQGQMFLDLAKLDADLAILRGAGLIKRAFSAADLATTEFLPAP